MIKYVSNVFLATKISFINGIADACEYMGANIDEIIEGIGHDPGIGKDFWKVGHGYGNACLSKDVRALIYTANVKGYAIRILWRWWKL